MRSKNVVYVSVKYIDNEQQEAKDQNGFNTLTKYYLDTKCRLKMMD